jgi:hypothetical protein
MDELESYMKNKYSMSEEERMAAFRKLAESFGPASEKTIALRQRMRNAGVAAAFSCGQGAMTDEELVEFVESPEIQKIIKGLENDDED